jgi:hypothetical protein
VWIFKRVEGMKKKRVARLFLLAASLWLAANVCTAQDLEPRRWSHLPTGLNVVGVGVGLTEGDIFFDPVLRVEDATFELYALGASYVRTFEWLGKSARIDFKIPYANGRWEGLLDGEYASRRRNGLADPHVRLSMNLYGAPPLRGREFMQYRQNNPVNTTVGAAVDIGLPLGQYNSEWLINLGSNRYVIRPQLGILHQRQKWQFELTGSLFLFQDNDEFWMGTRLEQDPLWFLQGHVIYGFKPGWWASLSGGYAYGGEAYVNDVPKNNDARSGYWAIGLGLPLNARQSLTFTFVTADSHVLAGADTRSLVVSWSVNWGG